MHTPTTIHTFEYAFLNARAFRIILFQSTSVKVAGIQQ